MSIAAHRSIEFALGLALVAVPLVLAVGGTADSGAASILVTIALGAALTFLGVSERREGGAIGMQTHAAADRLLAALLLVAGVVFVVADDQLIGALCLAAGLIEVALILLTRYTASPAGRTPASPSRRT